MTIDVQIVGDVVVLDMRGKITLGEGDELLKQHVNAILAKGLKKVVLNLAGIRYIDSAGNGEIVRTYTTVSRQGGAMLLCHPSPRIFDLLCITKLRTVYKIVPSIEDALAAFQSGEHLEAGCEAICPACGPVGKARFTVGKFFDTQACVACGVSFRITEPGSVGHAGAHTTGRLWAMSFPTYAEESVRVAFERGCTIDAPRRLDLFSVEVLEKAWSLIPVPRAIVLDVVPIEEFTPLGLSRLIELSSNQRGNDRSVYMTRYSWDEIFKRESAIADRLSHTGRTFDDFDQARSALRSGGAAPLITLEITRRGYAQS